MSSRRRLSHRALSQRPRREHALKRYSLSFTGTQQAVEDEPGQVVRVTHLVQGGDPRAEGHGGVDALALQPLPTMRPLQIALRNVVGDTEAEDVVEGLFLGYRPAVPADDECSLCLVVPLVGDLRVVGDVVMGTDDGVRALGEEGGAFRPLLRILSLALALGLFEVVPAVPARAENVPVELRSGGPSRTWARGCSPRCGRSRLERLPRRRGRRAPRRRGCRAGRAARRRPCRLRRRRRAASEAGVPTDAEFRSPVSGLRGTTAAGPTSLRGSRPCPSWPAAAGPPPRVSRAPRGT